MAEDTDKIDNSKANNVKKDAKPSAENSMSSMLNKPMPPKPPASPNVINKPAAQNLAAKNAVNADKNKKPAIANAAKKAASAKKIIDRKAYKAPNKKKSLLVGIMAFMLAGGAIFIMMIMMGAKDLKDQDARMNFSYSNVLAGAVAPLFEALGITDADAENLESTRRRLAARDPNLFALSIEDWLGKKNAPASSSADSGMSSGKSFGSFGNKDYSSSSEPMPRADFGMGGGFSGGGGGSQTSGNGKKGSNTFSSSSVKDAIDFKNGGSAKNGLLPSMKGKNALAAAKATRQMLSGALTSGSANTARSNWNASFGQGQARATGGKASGFDNGKLDKSAFKDANALAFDRIESGEIMNLKGSEIGGKTAVPDASVPALAESAAKGKDVLEDEMDKLISQAVGNVADSAFSGKDKESESSKTDSGQVTLSDKPEGLGQHISNYNAPDEYKNLVKNDPDTPLCKKDYCGDLFFRYKDNEPTYEKTKNGAVLVVFTGSQSKYDKNGNPVPGTEKTYKDKYLVQPNGNPKFTHIVSEIIDSDGQSTTSYREQL